MFNDDKREWELREICGTCGHRNGLHSMMNKCPTTNNQGRILRAEFAHTKFLPTGRYEEKEAA